MPVHLAEFLLRVQGVGTKEHDRVAPTWRVERKEGEIWSFQRSGFVFELLECQLSIRVLEYVSSVV